MEIINQRVKEIRLTLGLSQAKFAKAISISNGYIAGIELGNRKVNDRLIKLISITFNVREEWLKNGGGSMFIAQPNQSAELAFAAFKELQPEFQNYVLMQINQLLVIQRQGEKQETISQQQAQSAPQEQANLDIEAELASYRRELELEKKAKEKSEASPNSKEA